MNGPLLGSTAFLASAVEAVEALTIVLAVGIGRSWRAALAGTGWALATLAALVLLAGPALASVPFGALETVVGTLLLLVGLAWLRKAILRAAGRKALHDEAAIFDRQLATLRAAPAGAGADRLGFATAYQAVVLEGLEVAVIVVTVGASSAAALQWASAGAGLAIVLVAAVGFALRAPLRRVPENALKFAVGLMLTAVGTFWSGEGLGIRWPGGDWSLLALVAFFAAVAGASAAAAKRTAG